MPSEVGRVVGGRWEIERQLARGGMGVVWVARHRVTRQLVALKVLYTDGPRQDELHERLLREAAAPAQIGHPGLVRVYDAGVDPADGSMYLAMELLQGESLRDRFARPGLTRQTALGLVVELLEPLAAAHALGFVHRDLKPQNAFLARQEDGSERVKLLDFGLSRAPGVRTVTNANNLMGTAIYTAPEQLRSARTVGPQADVWSVGVTLYQILAGKVPFEGQTVALLGKILSEPAPPLRTVAPDVPPALGALVERCLDKDPAARPADAGELRRELVAALGTVIEVLPQDTLVVAEMPTDPMASSPAAPEAAADEAPSPDAPAAPPAEKPAAPKVLAVPATLGILGAAVPIMADSAVTKRRPARLLPTRLPVVVGAAMVGGAGAVLLVFAIVRSPAAPARSPGPDDLGAPAPPAAGPIAVAAPPPFAPREDVPAPSELDEPARNAEGVGDAGAPDEATAPSGPGGPRRSAAEPSAATDAPRHLEEPGPPWPASLGRPQQQQQQQQRVSPPSANPRDCGPITNATAARCFIAATGGLAQGEYMLRNLILANTLIGERGRARPLASRYFAEYSTSPFARQVRQLGYSP